jgi:DNA-binding PadR family transcriptional regulator
MVPDTRYAILGLLLRGPSHGYELAARFGELLGPGWAIDRGQVYDMLRTLKSKGWVEPLNSPETTQDSQSYRITPEGERAFVDWLAKPLHRSRPHRAGLHLKLTLAGTQDAHHLLKDIDIEKQACVSRLNAYTVENACPLPANASEWETLAREAVDEDVTTQLHAKLEWLENLRKRVEHRLSEHPQNTSGEAGDGAQSGRSDAAA